MKRIKATKRMVVILLMTMLTLNVAAQSVKDKTVTLDMTQVTVKQFFAEVKKQTGLNFIYSAELAKTFPKVAVKAQNRPVRQVLNEVMNKINCVYDVEGNIVTVTRKISGARTRTVSGTVKDDAGDPLPGVSICIDDSKVCTITDINGFYTLKVPANACDLKYSFVGMDNAVAHLNAGNGHVNQDVTMTSSAQLEEVIVTGYQDISKPKMTGAVTTITADKLDDRYTTNIVSNLEGRVAGLSTYGGEMKIRGTSSLYAETSPLIVIDGVPVETKISDINPYDIESINVLKDAAATAIYGARASNGIIVITTKNAKKKGKIDIDFSANLSIWEDRNMDYHYNYYMNAAEQVEVENNFWNYYYKGYTKDGVAHGPIADPLTDVTTTISNGYGGYMSPIQYAYYQMANGELSQSQFQSMLSQLKNNNYAKEYGDAVYKQQVMQQYNLSLRGRSDKFQNNLTLNYKSDNLGMINNKFNQLNIQYKGIFDLAKWLMAKLTVNGIYQKTTTPGSVYESVVNYTSPWELPAYESLYNTDGSLRRFHGFACGNQYMELPEGLYDLGTNPLEEYYRNTETNHRQHMRYHGELLFKIIDGLTAQLQYVYENSHTTNEWLASEESFISRSIRNAYATYDPSTGKVTYATPETGGMKRVTNTDGRYWTARGQINYNKVFGKHEITAIAGLEFRETKTKGTRTLLLGYDEQLQTSATHTIDFGTLSQIERSSYFLADGGGFIAHQAVFAPYFEEGMGVEKEVRHKYASGYFNATYTYDEKYNLFASFRKDYADVYGLNAKFRGKPLWSVGLGWIASNEPFMKDVKWLNFLKLRLSYGVTGNIYQGATSYMTASTGTLNYVTNLPIATIVSPANPNLKWEQNRTTNIGIDYSLFNNRLRGALDYYKKEGKDIFSYLSLDPVTGFTSMFVNTANMNNKGIELQLTYDWLRANTRDSFGWTSSFTFSSNKNKITKVDNPSTTAVQQINNPYVEGYPSSALWAYRFAGISSEEGEQGMVQYYIDNDRISHSAVGSPDILVFAGQSEPKVIMGLDNSFHYQGFSLSVLMAYYGGHKMRARAEREMGGGMIPTSAIPSYFLNAWTPDNMSSTPGIGEYGARTVGSEPLYADNSIRDADFLKIRNIVFGYEFPQQWIGRLGINRLSLRFQIDNPKWLWIANKVNVDPETLGIRNPSSFIFGVNINL